MQLPLFEPTTAPIPIPAWWSKDDDEVCRRRRELDERPSPWATLPNPSPAQWAIYEAWLNEVHPDDFPHKCRNCLHFTSPDGEAGICEMSVYYRQEHYEAAIKDAASPSGRPFEFGPEDIVPPKREWSEVTSIDLCEEWTPRTHRKPPGHRRPKAVAASPAP